MSMSTHVVGFAPPDDKWKQMKAVYDACKEAGIEAPKEVMQFFDWRAPSESGIEVELENHECVAQYRDSSRDGYEIDLQKVPANVRFIRFYNAY